MEAELMPGAFFDGVSLGASLAILYITIGVLIAMARWKAWGTEGDTLAKTLIAPNKSLDAPWPCFENRRVYCAAVSLFWPAVLAWNAFTLALFALMAAAWLGIIALNYAIDAGRSLEAAMWRNLQRTQRAAVRFLSASPERRIRWRIQRLMQKSRRLYGTIARDRIRVAAMDAKVNALTDSLPEVETGHDPYRSAKLRAVG